MSEFTCNECGYHFDTPNHELGCRSKQIQRKATVLQRFATGHINTAKLEYNDLTDQIILHVILPEQLAEIHKDDVFISFLTQKQIRKYLNEDQ